MDVLVQTEDDDLARRLEDACRERGHRLTRLPSLKELATVARARESAALLIDVQGSPADVALVAATVAAVHGDLSIALAVEKRDARSVRGSRTVDKQWPGERMLDELELACIGIPASTGSGQNGPVAWPSPSD